MHHLVFLIIHMGPKDYLYVLSARCKPREIYDRNEYASPKLIDACYAKTTSSW